MAQPLDTSTTSSASLSDGVAEPRGKVLPLNSKRLKTVQLQRLARALSIPTSASGDELRQLIDGKLEGMEREPRNVQVVILEAEHGAERLSLWDDDGAFLEIDPEIEHVGARGGEDGVETEPVVTVEGLQAALDCALEENKRLKTQLEQQQETLEKERGLMGLLEEEKRKLEESALPARVSELEGELKREREKMKSMWRMQCEQMVQCDNEIAEREAEISELRAKLAEHESHESREIRVLEESTASGEEHKPLPSPGRVVHRGKAPPVDAFTGEEAELRLEDWLPTLERASSWNGWTQEELLMQFAGYLRGRALQEWNLLGPEERESYETATQALRTRLDPGGRALAAQDFRHTLQRESEAVGDFVRRLERTFQIAYGRDPMSAETRDTLLHSQLQEGLRYEILKAPAVSGAQSYKELCLAAKNEEKRQAELRKRVQYQSKQPKKPSGLPSSTPPPKVAPGTHRCYGCGRTGPRLPSHIAARV